MDITMSPQDTFLAGLQRATAGMTYTPSQIAGLTNVAKSMGITDKATLQVIANAPQRKEDTPSRDTSPTRVYNTSDYARTAPALSSAQLGALGERRRLAEEQYQQTLAKVARNEAIYTADAERRRSNEESLSSRFIQDSMRELAGKSTARAPMFAGRMMRVANQDLQMKWGEIDSNLGIEMAALKSLVDEARSKREMELTLVEQDRASMRSNLDAIFSAASMYGRS